MRVASIDIGTNTLRLFIGELRGKELVPLLLKREITRLGGGFKHGVLHPESIKRTLKSIKEFMEIINEYRVERVRAVGTRILRDAFNKSEFIELIKKECGLKVEIISWEAEARLTLKGVLAGTGISEGLPRDDFRGIIFDIGGGSTEFILTDGVLPLKVRSLDLGVVYLTERFIHSDPPSTEELSRLKDEVREKLSELDEDFRMKPSILIGTAGTITTLALIDQDLDFYDRGRINGYILYKKRVEMIFNRIKGLTLKERRNIRGLDRGREDIIIAGIIITVEVMDGLGFEKLKVSDCGLVEGLLLDMVEQVKA